jgi:hypothetical protein
MSGLTNFQIEDLSKKLNIKLNAVCVKNELKDYDLETGLYVINLENSDKGGSHWTGFIIYEQNRRLKSFYCDSFGMLMPEEVIDYLKPLKEKISYNNREIQDFNTSYCGYYPLSLAYTIENSRTSDNILNDINKWLSAFSDDLSKNKKVLELSFLPHKIKI